MKIEDRSGGGDHDKVEALLRAVLAAPPADQAASLARACDEHPDLADALRRRFATHHDGAEARTMHFPGDGPSHSDRLGPFRILDVLGEGGMGVVYAAEQREPIRRRVAVKVIKVGMDTKEVLARFEAERQALALLDHPNIAKVLDAGATATGRPWFAMELVRGVSITRYCDDNRLPVRDRLDLLLQTCAALQHAHERGILHRDVKPTNLLVTEIDGKPVVKVIDFGLAKATNQRLTERTLFTEEGRVIGTPEYMSPEQAETSAQDVDARSDVFSLGVVLYELLAGVLPFDFKAVRAKGYFEVLRCIRDEEPPTPRQRLSALEQSLDEVLRQRRCRLHELAGSLRNGLDAVTMKAIAKLRRDRYASCEELAADIRSFLDGKPVAARQRTAFVRLVAGTRRLAARSAGLLPTVLLAVSIAIATTWWWTRSGSASGDTEGLLQPPQWVTQDILVDVVSAKRTANAVEISARLTNDNDREVSFDLADMRLHVGEGQDIPASPGDTGDLVRLVIQAKSSRTYAWTFPVPGPIAPGEYSVNVKRFRIGDREKASGPEFPIWIQ